MKFLSYDSKFSQILLRLCKSCCLNALWMMCSLPVFTIGASTTALYYASFKIVKEEDRSLTRTFFRAFRENFRQATVLWLIFLAFGILLGADGYFLYRLRANSSGAEAMLFTLMLACVIAAAVVYVIALLYVFPLVASVSNTNWAMVKNSFLIGTHYLFCTILVFAIHFAMFFAIVVVFTPLFLFGEGLCALLSSYLLVNVIRACSYDPDDDVEDDDVEDDEDGGGV